MRKIFKIASLELSVLFYSPVAWLVLTIFMIQCGIGFFENLQGIVTGQSLGYEAAAITNNLFGDGIGLFTMVQGTLYLYLPILTMGIMSRETNSGSIKLLLSSPVKLRQIILGKYLAIVQYGLLLIGILLIYVIMGLFIIKDIDLGRIFSGLLGLYLLICTYAAIGLFMSCLTNYQVVAAISTLAVFASLRYIGSVGQNLDLIRDLTYFLSISGRTEKMVLGMVTTRDIFYYLIIIMFFLLLSLLYLRSERESKPWTVKAGRYLGLTVLALLLGYISSRPTFTGYFDATAPQSLTISKRGRDIAKKISGTLKVTTYANLLAPNLWYLLPVARNNDLATWEAYQRFIPGMEMDYVYYYQKPVDSNYHDFRFNPNLKGVTATDKIAKQMVASMDLDEELFIAPDQIGKMIDLAPEGFLAVRKLEYGKKHTYLRFFMGEKNPYAYEAEILAAMNRLVIDSPPKVVFVTGNGERSTVYKNDREYQMISAFKTRRLALVNQGFDVDTVDLDKQDIAKDASIVVMADPTTKIGLKALQKLAVYINSGGNMLINGEPGRQEILNQLLEIIGVKLRPGLLVKPDRDRIPGLIKARFSPSLTKVDTRFAQLRNSGTIINIQGASAIDYSAAGNFTVTPLLISEEGGGNMTYDKSPIAGTSPTNDSDKGIGGTEGSNSAEVSMKATKIDEMGVFPIAVSLRRYIGNKQQRIIVSGDADFLSNGELLRANRGENRTYMQSIFGWLCYDAFPISVINQPPKDTHVKVSSQQVVVLMWLSKLAIPLVMITLGAITLYKRRRK